MSTIPIDSIIIEDRQRVDYPDIDKLAASLQRYGLIQPVVLDDNNRLIAGGRRTRAAKLLGWTEIPCVRLGDLTEIQRAELELEENVCRSDLSWQERVMAIAKIHDRRSRDAALDSEKWGFEQTGELLGMTKSNVWYATTIGHMLANGDDEMAKADNLAGAIQLLIARKANTVERFITNTRHAVVRTASEGGPKISDADGAEDGEADEAGLAKPITVLTDPFISSLTATKLGLECRLYNQCGLEWLESQPAASVDYIYSDPPYAIEMDTIQQANVGMNVDLVKETHDVVDNIDTLKRFVKVLPKVLKPTSFAVFWCDQVHWAWLSELAEAGGLRVQRWPIVWVKQHQCQNTQAYKNFTKNIEIAMLVAMPQATLVQPRSQCTWVGATDKQNYDITNPFWKPINLHKWILEAIATKGSTVVDPFAGCGSIPLACLLNGYNTIGIEKDATHFIQMERLTK